MCYIFSISPLHVFEYLCAVTVQYLYSNISDTFPIHDTAFLTVWLYIVSD